MMLGNNRVLVFVAIFTVLGLLLSGCGPGAAPTPTAKAPAPTTTAATPAPAKTSAAPPAASPAATPKPAAEQPRAGGILSLPIHSDPPNLDIHQNVTITLFAPINAVYNGLVQYDVADKVVPDLAEKWDMSSDGKVYTFSLRKGVKFHDGSPFTATDAKISLDRIIAYEGLKFQVEAVDKVDAKDDSTLVVTLKQRNAGFLPLIGHGRTLMGSKKVIDAKKDLKRDAVGTGPFKLKEYIVGTSFVLEKNKDYFVKDRPYLDGINYYIIKDAATRLASFRTGRVQMHGTPPVQSDLAKSQRDLITKENPQIVVKEYKSAQGYGMMPNWERKPWDDVRVRRAAFLAVDRQKGLDVVSEGVGELGVTEIYGEWALSKDELAKMPGFRQPKDQDIAEAKKLLADAGYPNGFKSSIIFRAADPLYEKASTFMADQLSKVGIDLELKVTEYALFVEARSKMTYDTMLVVNPLPLTDPEGAGRYISRKLGGQFASGDDDKTLDLIAKQSLATTVEERKKIVNDLQYRVAEVVPHIFIAWQNSFIAYWPQVKGYDFGGGVYSHNRFDSVWLAK